MIEKNQHLGQVHLNVGQVLRITRQFLWLGGGQFGQAVVGFALTIVLANYVTKTQYAIYQIALSTQSTLAFLGLSALGTILMVQIKEKSHLAALRASGFTLLVSSLGSLLIVLYGGYWWIIRGESYVGLCLVVVAVFFPFLYSFNYYQSVFVVEKRFDKLALAGMATSFLSALMIIPTALFFPSPILLITEWLMAQTLVQIYFSLQLKGSLDWRNYIPTKSDKFLLDGSRLSFYESIVGLGMNLDKVILAMWLPLEAIASYSFITLMPEFIKTVLKQAENIGLSRLVHLNRKDFAKNVWIYTGGLSVLLVLAISAYIGLVPFVMKFLFPKYADLVPYTRVYCLSLVSVAIVFMYNYFRFQKQEKKVLILNVVYLVVSIGSLFVFVPHFGLWGAVYSRLVTRLIHLILHVYLFVVDKKSN